MIGFFKWFFSTQEEGEKQSYVGIVALLMLLIVISVNFAPWHKGEAHHTFWVGSSAWFSGYWLCRFLTWRPR